MEIIYIWIMAALFFICIDLLLVIFLVVVMKKTHAMSEVKAWFAKKPLALYFQENRYCEWKPVTVKEGVVQDRRHGAYIVNQRATYVDKTTKNILLPFDASFNPDLKISTEELTKDFSYLIKDEEEMKKLRIAIAEEDIEETDSINTLTTSIHLAAIKNMTTALVPHNIVQKIEKIIATKVKSYGDINVKELLILFGAVFGVIVIGAIVVKSMSG